MKKLNRNISFFTGFGKNILFWLFFRKLVFAILIFFSPQIISAQTTKDTLSNQTDQHQKEQLIQQILELVAEDLEEENIDLTDLYYQLSFRCDHPLELNKATREELQSLHLLTASQLNNLINHRNQFGEFISIYELQAVEGFDLQMIQKILPIVRVGKDISEKTYSIKDYFTKGSHEYFARYSQTLEEERGYRIQGRNQFLGSPYSLYTRYNYRFSQKLSIGFTADKDAGEEFFKGTQKQGFDFYSAHLYYSGGKTLKTLAIGDFQLQFGQGLTLWSALAINKTPDVLNIARNARGILPFRSANENLFMRGAALTIGAGKFTFTTFTSHKNIDANRTVTDTLSGQDAFFSSFLLSGYHRNLPELENKNTVKEMLTGGEVSFRNKNLRLGISGIYGNYNVPFQRQKNVYNLFAFNAQQFWNTGLNYSYLFRNIYFFGESAYSGNGSLATLNGALISLHSKFDIGILYRNISRDYQAPYANAFAEASGTSNEKGTYLAAVYKPTAKWRISAFADRFTFPWLRYRLYSPGSVGNEFLVDVNYNPAKKVEMYVRFRSQTKDLNLSSTQNPEPVYQVVQTQKQSLRFHLNYQVSQKLSLRSRLELSEFKEMRPDFMPQKGFLAFQDLDYRSANRRYGITFRYVLFDVESYDARIYTFENDVPFAFSIPFFQDEGYRYYVIGQYRINKYMTLHARFARTTLLNKNTFGSGLNEIDGNKRTEVKVQLRVRF